MTDISNKSAGKPALKISNMAEHSTKRPFCVFFVNPAMPKAIHTDTIVAAGPKEATALAGEKHKDCMILHVRSVGSDASVRQGDCGNPQDRVSGYHLPLSRDLPGARFINGEFLVASGNDETDPETL